MKKLPNKLAASVRKVKEQSAVAPTPAKSAKSAATIQRPSIKTTPATTAAAAVRSPGQLHPTRVWPD